MDKPMHECTVLRRHSITTNINSFSAEYRPSLALRCESSSSTASFVSLDNIIPPQRRASVSGSNVPSQALYRNSKITNPTEISRENVCSRESCPNGDDISQSFVTIPTKDAKSPESKNLFASFSTSQKEADDGDNTKETQSQHMEERHVHQIYSRIAPQCGHVKQRAWPRVVDFLKQLPPNSLVADVGCGSGRFLGLNLTGMTFGSDICREFVTQAMDGSHQLTLADNIRLPYRSAVFDAAISIGVVHHFASGARRARAIQELARILSPGGRVMIYVWAFEQIHRKFEKQDVLIPWKRPEKRGNAKRSFSCSPDKESSAFNSTESLASDEEDPSSGRTLSRSQSHRTPMERGRTTLGSRHSHLTSSRRCHSEENARDVRGHGGETHNTPRDKRRKRFGVFDRRDSAKLAEKRSEQTDHPSRREAHRCSSASVKTGSLTIRRRFLPTRFRELELKPSQKSQSIVKWSNQMVSECRKVVKLISSLSDKDDRSRFEYRPMRSAGKQIKSSERPNFCNESTGVVYDDISEEDHGDIPATKDDSKHPNAGLYMSASPPRPELISTNSRSFCSKADTYCSDSAWDESLENSTLESSRVFGDSIRRQNAGLKTKQPLPFFGDHDVLIGSMRTSELALSASNNNPLADLHRGETMWNSNAISNENNCYNSLNKKSWSYSSLSESFKGNAHSPNTTSFTSASDSSCMLRSYTASNILCNVTQSGEQFSNLGGNAGCSVNENNGQFACETHQSKNISPGKRIIQAINYNKRTPKQYQKSKVKKYSNLSSKTSEKIPLLHSLTSKASVQIPNIFNYNKPNSPNDALEAGCNVNVDKANDTRLTLGQLVSGGQDIPDQCYDLVNNIQDGCHKPGHLLDSAWTVDATQNAKDAPTELKKENNQCHRKTIFEKIKGKFSFFNLKKTKPISSQPVCNGSTSPTHEADGDSDVDRENEEYLVNVENLTYSNSVRVKPMRNSFSKTPELTDDPKEKLQGGSSCSPEEPHNLSIKLTSSSGQDTFKTSSKRPNYLDFSKKRPKSKTVKYLWLQRDKKKTLTLDEAMTLLGNGRTLDSIMNQLDAKAQTVFLEMKRLNFSIRNFPMSSLVSGKKEGVNGGDQDVHESNQTHYSMSKELLYNKKHTYQNDKNSGGRNSNERGYTKLEANSGRGGPRNHQYQSSAANNAKSVRFIGNNLSNNAVYGKKGTVWTTLPSSRDHDGDQELTNSSSNKTLGYISCHGSQSGYSMSSNTSCPIAEANDDTRPSVVDVKLRRYYHVFKKNELESLIRQHVPSLEIVETFYDHANWCVIARKL